MKKVILKLSAVCVLVCVVNLTTFATDIEKKVVFPKGKSTVTYSGKLPTDRYDAYIVKLRKGQRLKVTFSSDDPKAFFHVFELEELGPDEDQIFEGNFETREFSGVAPVTSSYAVQIYDGAGTRSKTAYTVTISVVSK